MKRTKNEVQAEAIREFLLHDESGIIAMATGTGKALWNKELVLTPKGWVLNETLRVNDLVIGDDGKPVSIIAIHPQGTKELFEVEFCNGDTVKCTKDHLWEIISKYNTKKRRVVSLEEIMNHKYNIKRLDKRYNTVQENLSYYVRLTSPIEYDIHPELPIDPYTLGVLIGDGCLKGAVTVTLSDKTIINKLQFKEDITPKLYEDKDTCITYGLTSIGGNNKKGRIKNSLVKDLTDLGLYGLLSIEKFIPEIYLYGTIEQRRALLQGLLDTDGHIMKGKSKYGNCCEYSTSSKKLKDDVINLAKSLGIYVRWTERIPIYTHKEEKLQGTLSYRIYLNFTKTFKSIRKITQIDDGEATCITVANENGLYITNNFTITHNSKIGITLAIEQWKKNPDCQILLVVPTQKLRDNNWKDEFDKWNAHHVWAGNITRICYASLHKVTGFYDFVILDEVHNITENNSVFFENTRFSQIIGLTATMPNKIVKLDILKKYGLNVIYTVTTDEAVEWGLISPYKITIIYSSLDRINKNVASGRKENPFYQTELQAYEYLTKTIKNLQYEEVKDFITGQIVLERRILSANESARLQMLILKRMHLVYNLTSKYSVALYIRDHLISDQDRTLIFAGSIKQAEAICENSFHSKSKKTDSSFDDFCNKRINMLSCVDALNEGHNIPDVDNALILQLNSSKLDMIQRIGRIVRYRDDHVANIFIVVAKDTVDEDWVKKALQDFDDENITKILFNDLKLQHLNEVKSRTEEYFY